MNKNKEIKIFRGKDIETGEWIYGYLVKNFTGRCFILNGNDENIQNNFQALHREIFSTECFYEVVPKTIGQYIGLKDKNNKQIYEGDIIHYISHEHECIGVIKFGIYNQDGSDGEYDPEKCLGFYIDRIKMIPEEWDDEEFFNDEYKYTKTNSILYYDIKDIEIIGDAYRNPELLE